MSQPLQILIVEDSRDDAELVLRALRRAGYEPDWRRVDTEAEYLELLHPGLDLVLSDYQMPQFNGMRALELLQQRGLEIPFILISGTIGEDTAVEAMKKGAADYLLKDRLARLGLAVAQALEARRLRMERRRAEQVLLLQGTALETAANAVVITDPMGTILWVNAAFTALTGYAADEAVGHTPRLLKSGKHPAEFYKGLWAAILAGKTWRGSFTNRRKDGSLYFDEHTVTPVRSQAGAITHFVAIMNDVTERRTAEKALRSTLAQLRDLLDHSPAVIYAATVESGKITPRLASANISRLLGFDVAETLSTEWWLAQLHPDDRERAVASIQETLALGVGRTEYRLRHKDGSYRWVDDNRRLVRDAQGAATELSGIWTDITERKASETALRDSEARLRIVTDTAQVGMVIVDREHRYRYANRAYEKILRLPTHEIVGQRIADVLAPVYATQIQPRLESAFRGEQVNYELTLPATGTGDTERQFAVAYEPGTNGQERVVVVVIVDITERKRAQKALAESERRLREMLETINLIAMTLDRHGTVTFCNDYLLRLTGWRREEVIGADWFAKFIPDSAAETKRLFFDTVAAGSIQAHHENPIRTKTGELREIAWNNTTLRDAAGNAIGTASIGEDITERRRAEQSLRASEERFRQVVENIREVFWMTDVEKNQILYISPGYEVIWGRACESLYASSLSWLESIHPEDRDRILTAAQVKQAIGQYDETYRIVRPDGVVRWVHDRAYPIKDRDGAVRRVVGVAEDVTERKQLEEQFLRAQRLESIGMLAAGIAHDLNNVLAPITMATPLLRANASAPGDLRLLDTLAKCADRGAGLVRQILGFAHGVGGEPRPVQVKHLLRDILGVTATFPKSIVIEDEVSANLWTVLGNPTQIHQILLNLCVNARDAMPHGGSLRLRAENCVLDETAAAGIEGARPGAWLMLQVEDTGTGIAPEVVARIWEPFFTTKSADKGTGLGLSTVRGIVESHRGFVTLHTTLDRGTRFRVYLPAADSADTGDTGAGVSPATPGRGELILLVDDEEPIRAGATAILEHAGYRVVPAADGVAAATLFAERPDEFALVITDLDMPNLDGAGLSRIIHRLSPGLNILTMSGLARRHTPTGSEAAGVGFMPKPFTAEALLDHVQRILRPASPHPKVTLPWPRF